MSRKLAVLLAIVLLGSAGCAVNTRKQMVKAGGTPLAAKGVYRLVAGHTLHLASGDFDGKVFFSPDGKLSGKDRLGSKDTGKWDVTSDNRLCLAFSTWYYGDVKCYDLVASEGTIVFFTPNGARYYTANRLPNNPAELVERSAANSSPTSLRKKLAAQNPRKEQSPEPVERPSVVARDPAPQPSEQEMKHILITTAANCPQCDLAGTDLSEADLTEANLTGANLAGADLSGANLHRAQLSGANLAGANLFAANLSGADLSNCNLEHADLSGSNLIMADFTGALTSGMKTKGALIEDTKGLK